MTPAEPQGPGWAFAFFHANGQELGPAEVESVANMATTVVTNAAILRTAVNPDTPFTAIYSAGDYFAASPSRENLP
jgi:hypothetical protein